MILVEEVVDVAVAIVLVVVVVVEARVAEASTKGPARLLSLARCCFFSLLRRFGSGCLSPGFWRDEVTAPVVAWPVIFRELAARFNFLPVLVIVIVIVVEEVGLEIVGAVVAVHTHMVGVVFELGLLAVLGLDDVCASCSALPEVRLHSIDELVQGRWEFDGGVVVVAVIRRALVRKAIGGHRRGRE